MLKSPVRAEPSLLSQTAEHALRALLFLARRNGEAATAGEIARATGSPANYLSKTLQVLARHGVVQGTRGPNGGFRLTRNPAEMTVADVSALFAEPARARMCLLGGVPCSNERACPAHSRWVEMQAAATKIVSTMTLAGLLDGRHGQDLPTTLSGEWS